MSESKHSLFLTWLAVAGLVWCDAARHETWAQPRARQDSSRVQPRNVAAAAPRTAEAARRAAMPAKAPALPPDFEVVRDRWQRIKPPPYELNVRGRWYDPYNQNKLKGDRPLFGQNTFLIFTASADNFLEAARLPTPSGVSTATPQSQNFFGDGDRLLASETLRLRFDLYHGDTAFRPRDWELRVTPVFNFNYLDLRESNVARISPRNRTDRSDRQLAFQELSLEKHLFNLSDRYDFISCKAGIQRMFSDFRGFIFSDFNLGGRLFGNLHSNRYQYNLAFFYQLEKDTNSELNTVFADRNQQVYLINLYRQDFFTPGYTAQWSLHYNVDRASIYVDTNGFPTRPALLGTAAPHTVRAFYLGWTGDGHLGRWNINHAFYQVLGNDSRNQLAGRRVRLNAQMAALELSIDQDWKRYKASAFYASGDAQPFDAVARGFDAIVDQPFFAGGQFSFWNQQAIRLLGVNLVNRQSLLPNLRSSKTQGQPNFVNPGLLLFNLAWEAEWTPKLRSVLNANYLRFATTAPLQQFLNQAAIRNDIALDFGLGFIYRPFLNNNAIITLAATALSPLGGFIDIYQSPQMLYSVFASLVFTY
ncbi:MAG: hypothetical protein ONB48_12990 [candidate division KSB1 bacterium]|nr:hypothetical protein [candidate division KSB1 bacterium]MDZ7274986.1 hypothetical protein [candidate division KSB1 bacterium]MDZ7286563.1 hypothetical protein [candidate division KSB1 bacterium]MDZ7299273.1 hypothetical protein [candidate division KSB1 bacterium]MDZ7306067.1 hypothetical protein [candidate division KSB1 bacterium]